MNKNDFVETLISASDTQARVLLLKGNSELAHVDTVYALKERADQVERDDARRALEIGRVAEELAEYLNNDEARAVALWTQANAQDFLADLENADHSYGQAAQFFQAAGKSLEASRTGIGRIQVLSKLGRFEQAQALAEAARLVFLEHEDLTSQAKVDMNLGILYYTRGQYLSALEACQRATQAFQTLDNPLYAAINQINQANVLTVLDDFVAAEGLYEQAKPVFDQADMRSTVASVDTNLAILQSYRGNYSKAFQTFEKARAIFSGLAMQVNLAMTDLEESDLHLDLNLPDQALQLAVRAEAALAELQMPFESARARANQAVALARLYQLERAAELLEEARAAFVTQENTTWIAHSDLQRAEIMGKLGKSEQARQLAEEAARAYDGLGLKTKQAYAHILCANLWADEKKWTHALDALDAAEHVTSGMAVPWLTPRIEACKGRIAEGLGNIDEAIEHYRNAAQQNEKMMATLMAEEHRTAYIADKLQPYEALVSLYVKQDPQLAFQWAERAKSRALVDLLAAGIHPRLHIEDEMDALNAERLQVLREELNWLYARLSRGEAPGDTSAPAAVAETWTKIQEREKEASLLWSNLLARHAEELSLLQEVPLSAPDIQAKLPENSAIVEYFVARGKLIIFLLTRQEIFACFASDSIQDVSALMEELGFQFSKFQYGASYYARHKLSMLRTTQDILDKLGDKLLAPIWEKLSQTDAVHIIPHGPLHALPFHALRRNEKSIIETHAVSYAPSSAVLNYCWSRRTSQDSHQPSQSTALLVGVPDERATHVAQEIQAIAGIFKSSQVLLGEDATLQNVKNTAPHSDLLHLATHGLFRPEAPLLSAIHLADQWMVVQDVYDLDLKASLVTLSACETGLGRDMGGDELVGLVRGFLHAGAKSLLVSLWMVDDKAMTDLMIQFYNELLAGKPKAQALRQAQLDIMKAYEHPYYWAPIVLIGNEK